MFDYFKSELYRVIRSKKVYKFIAICSALMVTMNLLLVYCNNKFEGFAYGNVNSSLGFLRTNMDIPFILTLVLSIIVFSDEYKNGTIKNSVAYGISREKILGGKILASLVVSIVSLIIIEGILVGSAYALLQSQGIGDIADLLKATVSCMPVFVLGVIATISLVILFESETVATWSWLGIFIGISKVCELLGMKFKICKDISKWLVYNTISEYSYSKNGNLLLIWDTQDGLIKLIMTGIIGIAIFIVVALLGIKKKRSA